MTSTASARIFPILAMQVYGKPLVYLDNAASAQKPQAVLDRIQHAYTARIRQRASRPALSRQCRDRSLRGRARDGARASSTRARTEEIIFTRNATEAINLVASSFGRDASKAGDEIVLSIMEHHSNIVPWHFLRERQGAVIKWAPVDDDGNFLLDEFEKLLDAAHQDGRDHPHVERARHRRADEGGGAARACARHSGAGRRRQAAVHLAVDVQDLDCDFYVFTGHKLYGPTGIGVLYGKYELLEAMPPFNGGGEMIRDVSEDRVTYGEPPHRFEAGTPPIVQAIGLGAAHRLRRIRSAGTRIRAHEDGLLALCAGAAARDQFAAHLRHGEGQGRRSSPSR